MNRERWTTLAVVSIATAMLLLDVTVVNVALPAIRDDLDATFGEMQWVIDAYALMLAATLLGAGVLADRLGRRAVFAAGLAAFTASSALCGAVTGAALALGPVVGGVVVDAFNWRWIFLVNLPIGAALIRAALGALPESRGDRARPLDLAGMATFGVACFLVTHGLIRGNEDGWDSLLVAGSLVAAFAAFMAFIATERRTTAPMLPLEFFRIPAFSGTAMVAFAQSVALYALFLFLALYLQDALRLSPTGTGVRMLPITLVFFAVAPISGKLTGRLELRALLTAGLTLIAGSMLLMRGISTSSEWTHLLPGFIIGGLGMGVISPALAAAMVSVLPADRSGLASGINNTFRQLGIAIGIAGLGAIFQHHTSEASTPVAGIVGGLNAVLLVSALVALAGAVLTWPLLGRQRSGA